MVVLDNLFDQVLHQDFPQLVQISALVDALQEELTVLLRGWVQGSDVFQQVQLQFPRASNRLDRPTNQGSMGILQVDGRIGKCVGHWVWFVGFPHEG